MQCLAGRLCGSECKGALAQEQPEGSCPPCSRPVWICSSRYCCLLHCWLCRPGHPLWSLRTLRCASAGIYSRNRCVCVFRGSFPSFSLLSRQTEEKCRKLRNKNGQLSEMRQWDTSADSQMLAMRVMKSPGAHCCSLFHQALDDIGVSRATGSSRSLSNRLVDRVRRNLEGSGGKVVPLPLDLEYNKVHIMYLFKPKRNAYNV